MWLFFALLAPFFFAIVHVMDSYCVHDVFEKPWMGAITSAIASLVVFLLIPIFLPFTNFQLPTIGLILLALLSGALIQLSQVFYFCALSYSEAGIIAAYWNMIPAMLPVASFVLLKKFLSINEYLGIAILIFASICMCLIDTNFQSRWHSFVLMLFASFAQVIAYLIEDYLFDHVQYFIGFLLITTGLIIAGSLPLLSRGIQKSFLHNWKKLRSSFSIFVGIEIINLIALACAQKAISLGNPSLVAAVETTIPAYAFLLSIIIYLNWPRLSEKKVLQKIVPKFSLVAIMVIGVLLVS